MADYYPLIARAITGLDKNTGEARRALYERARTALVAQLRGTQPPLQESEITKERLALEEAIRKVEAEAARRSRIETAPQSPAAAPSAPPPPNHGPAPSAPRFPNAAPPAAKTPPRPTSPPPAGPAPAAPKPALNMPDFGPKTLPPLPPRPSAQSAPPPKPSPFDAPPPPLGPPFGAPAGSRPPRDPFAEMQRDFDQSLEPRLAQEDFGRETHPPDPQTGYRGGPPQDPSYQDPSFRGPPPPRPPEGGMDDDLDEQDRRKPRSFGALIKAAVAVLLLLAVAGVVYSQRGVITEFWQAFRGSSTDVAKESGPAQPTKQGSGKITDRLGGPNPQSGPAVAQKVVLYEEEPNDPQGKQFVGSAVWRTETVSPGPGRPPELAIRADVEIPERKMTMTFSIRRNTDQTLPASHTIEVMFNLPADFPPGGISNVPGVLMKQAEQTRGTPLAGLAVKVTNNFFLIGLSAVESDQARNIQLLKERAWFDIPIVYNNNRRAILAIEKGTPGERAFAEAFAAWKQ